MFITYSNILNVLCIMNIGCEPNFLEGAQLLYAGIYIHMYVPTYLIKLQMFNVSKI